jgi:phage terminase large subunit-like protein
LIDKGERAVGFINRLRHTKGEWAGKRFGLRDWQEKVVRDIFGMLDDDGNRVVRTAYVEIPRKNGKSEIAAAIALYLLFRDGEYGAEIYCSAADRDQASLVFNVAAQMVRMEPQLFAACKIIDSQKRIVRHDKGSFLKAISAESRTKFGFNAHGIIFDELHVQPNRELWDTLTTSTGARTQPLTFAITTAGYDRNSICWELHDYARKVRDGIVDDPTFYPLLYSAPEEADWTDEEVWAECNPALGDFRDLGEMRTLCARAKETPALENTFRRLYLNQWTKQETRYIPMDKWDACASDTDLEDLGGKECYGGLDLASTTDIAAFVLVFPQGEDYHVLPHFWIPEENMAERVRRDRVDYDFWVNKGLVTATPGNVIDYKWIFQTIDEAAQRYDILEIAFDRWGATKIVQELMERGMNVVQFGQGYKSMSPPTKELLNLVLQGRLRHSGNPVLRWMADNLVVDQDPAGNFKPNKQKSTEKIDGMVATIMALDRAIRLEGKQPTSKYETEDVVVL